MDNCGSSMFPEIFELQLIREEKEKLLRKEHQLMKPSFRDTSFIPVLYEWFNEIHLERDFPTREGSTRLKKQFVFIVMYLYSPGTLVGAKTIKGVREALARVLDFRSPSAISNLCTDITFLYLNYKDYKKELEWVYRRMEERIRIEMNDIRINSNPPFLLSSPPHSIS